MVIPSTYQERAITIEFDDLPEALRYFRELAGVSQSDIANAVGVKSTATISHYENGRRSVSLDVLAKIFHECGYTIKLYAEKDGEGE